MGKLCKIIDRITHTLYKGLDNVDSHRGNRLTTMDIQLPLHRGNRTGIVDIRQIDTLTSLDVT